VNRVTFERNLKQFLVIFFVLKFFPFAMDEEYDYVVLGTGLKVRIRVVICKNSQFCVREIELNARSLRVIRTEQKKPFPVYKTRRCYSIYDVVDAHNSSGEILVWSPKVLLL
jgi:hypothetical protein